MGARQDLYLQSHREAGGGGDADLAALLRAKGTREDRKPERPPVKEPEQEPAIEDPLPEESRDETEPVSPH
jgi:hypothetical protein